MKEHRAMANRRGAHVVNGSTQPHRAVRIGGMLLAITFSAGCDASKPETSEGSSAQSAASPASKSAADDSENPDAISGPEVHARSSSDSVAVSTVAFRTVDPSGLEAEVARHKGKVVLVDFWATYCIPCIQGLPKYAGLVRQQGDKGFVVITMALDEAVEDESEAEFLKRLSAPLDPHATAFTNLLGKEGGSEEAMSAYGIEGGALPHYRLYGRDGKLLSTFVSGDPDHLWDHTDVEKAIQAALVN